MSAFDQESNAQSSGGASGFIQTASDPIESMESFIKQNYQVLGDPPLPEDPSGAGGYGAAFPGQQGPAFFTSPEGTLQTAVEAPYMAVQQQQPPDDPYAYPEGTPQYQQAVNSQLQMQQMALQRQQRQILHQIQLNQQLTSQLRGGMVPQQGMEVLDLSAMSVANASGAIEVMDLSQSYVQPVQYVQMQQPMQIVTSVPTQYVQVSPPPPPPPPEEKPAEKEEAPPAEPVVLVNEYVREEVVERIIEVPVIKEKIVTVEVEKIVEVEVERIVEVEVEVERVVEKVIEVPVERIIEKFIEIEVPFERIVDRVVEKRVEVPVERVVERIVQVPVVIPAPEGVTRGVQTEPWEPEVQVVERERVVFREAPAKVVQVLQAVHVEPKSANVGVGLLLERNQQGLTHVEEVVHGFAAWKSGKVRYTDVVVAVDGRTVDGMSLPEVRKLTMGEEGTAVTIEFLRDGQYFSCTLVRTVPGEIDEGNVRAASVISRDSFSRGAGGVQGTLAPQTSYTSSISYDQGAPPKVVRESYTSEGYRDSTTYTSRVSGATAGLASRSSTSYTSQVIQPAAEVGRSSGRGESQWRYT